ncbi:unnamed protein product [Linum trigynum]|uniref:Retrotransposon Copia-like N-terminal domain-containing protein n=1 Tax=Linum trigynum TaxID=586398 RepID=A0AAV2CM93_9ROSI
MAENAQPNDPVNNAAGANAQLPADPMADPYYLHGSEQPGLLLAGEKLTPTNYNGWSQAMMNALGAKNKLGFINGSIPHPGAEHQNAWAWNRNNVMVLSWIQEAVEASI